MPVDIRGSVTNTSVTLQWKIPGELELDDAYYNVREWLHILCSLKIIFYY